MPKHDDNDTDAGGTLALATAIYDRRYDWRPRRIP
jgi:hypothetical protein